MVGSGGGGVDGDWLLAGVSDHFAWIEDAAELLLGEEFAFADEVGDALAGANGFGGEFGSSFVAQDGVEGGDDADAAFDELTAGIFVGGDAIDAVGSERGRGV